MRGITGLHLALGLAVSLLYCAPEAGAQESGAQAQREQQRRQIVGKNLKLIDSEAKAFWPVYRSYREKQLELDGKARKLRQELRSKSGSQNDKSALKLLKDLQEIRKREAEVRIDFIDRFAKALPVRKLHRYLQVENRVDAIMRYQGTSSVKLQR